uniref:hypothetical protein n=1 Tax=uncultured Planktosalinus sp. TaxID=1810935 RepID=UPI0030DD4B98
MKSVGFSLFISILLISCGASRKKYDSKIPLDSESRSIPKESVSKPAKVSKEVVLYNEDTPREELPAEMKINNIVE